jgi:hypothetical protein
MMFMVRKAPTPMRINNQAASHSSLWPCFT